MEVRLGLSQLKVDTVVGVYPHEREKKRRLIIDVEVVLLNHVKDDELDSTINYEKIANFGHIQLFAQSLPRTAADV